MKTLMVLLLLSLTLLPAHAEKAEWWDVFKDEQLSALIEKGLAEHPEPLAALRAVDGVRASRDQASASLKPSADVSLALRFGREKTMYTDRQEGDIDPFAGSANISWEIDLFGRARQAVRAADARIEISEAERQGIRLMLSTAIAYAYFESAGLRDVDAVDRDLLLNAVSRYRRVSARVGAGLQDQPALEKAVGDIQMALHHRMLTNIKQQKVLNDLKSLVGDKIELEDIPLLEALTLPTIPSYEADAQMQGRPDVLAAWWGIERFVAQAESTKGARAPVFEIVASAAAKMDDEGAEPWEAWVGPVVKLPLWRPDLKADSVRARSGAERAQANFESVARKAMLEISNAVVDREHADSMIAHLSMRNLNMTKAQDAAKRKYEAGLTREDDYLAAHKDQLGAKHESTLWHAQAFKDHLVLIKALGGSMVVSRQETGDSSQ